MAARQRGRVAVFGDIGGQLGEFSRALTDLGADVAAGLLPADLTVIQLGDLVHRGPDSPGVLDLVARFLSASGDQWVQLTGNHEEQYLFVPPRFHWPEHLDEQHGDLIRWWWRSRQMAVAAAVDLPDGQVLVTHAGLTEGFWRKMLGAPESAAEAAERINSMASVFKRPVFRAGTMLGDPVDFTAGPVWAASGLELLPSWLIAGDLPFDLVHGHSSAWNWRRKQVMGDEALRPHLQIDEQHRHVRVQIGDHTVTGIDPGHGAKAAPRWAPLVLTDALVVQPA
ncbi:hypothetical protein GIS00_11500 [Nakamurella sp. YIM 132087]|uniref:Calcineurin-like phosphoesterase domain-containing protein n=1 Tax=Nakamurella alba TaxID=2665158 RepID=A0A7K1FKH5_9ACTN|nr:metallophosphoesterase [Nakamurella alba]MTD14570.1 hypothetical protein [Nakamurella alba]